MPPFPTHDLLADFGELRHRLSLILEDESRASRADLVDAFLLACGLNQILEDYMGDGGAMLAAAARVVRDGAPRGLNRLSRPLGGTARWMQRRRDGGQLRSLQRQLALVVDSLADDMVRGVEAFGTPEITCREVLTHRLEGLSELHADVQSRVIRLPTCFRSLDQDPRDFGRLVDRFAELQPDRVRPVLTVGLRSSGSYTAPLCAAYLRAAGYQPVDTITIRPRQRWLPGEVERLRTAVSTSATIMLSDDPPSTGNSLREVARNLEAMGVDRDRIVIAVASTSDQLPESIAEYRHAVLPASHWAIHDRLSDDAIRQTLSELLAGVTIDVSSTDGRTTQVRVTGIRSVTRINLPPTMDPSLGSVSRRHARALFSVELVDEAEVAHRHLIYAKGTGLGYLGDHSLAVSTPLHEYLPAIYGLREGLMFRAWLPDEWNVARGQGLDLRILTRRIARYVLARRDALATGSDITDRLAGEGPSWKQASLLLRRGFGMLRLLALPIADHVALRLLRPSQPSVIDGSMALKEWFAQPGAGEAGIRKVDFDERAFCNQDLIKNLHCYDAIYDLASAVVEYEQRTSERDRSDEFVESLRCEYERALGSSTTEERWLLHQLVHNVTDQIFITQELADRKGASDPQIAQALTASQRSSSRAAQRYYRARFFLDIQVPAHGPLCAIDIDGVLESDQMGFPSVTPAGALALRALRIHGFRPVLVTGRSLDEVRERCRAYSLPGGVAEYGATVYARNPERTVQLSGDDAAERLGQLRARLALEAGVHLDETYRGIVRAYRFDLKGRRRHLEPATLKLLAPDVERLRLRQVDGAYQTDFVPEEVDKGKGLNRLRDMLGGADIPVALAVGDSPEDLATFPIAVKGFAPGNAQDDVRKAARELPNLHLTRRRAQVGLAEAAASVIGHRPGECASCARPDVDAEGRLLLTVMSAPDGRKVHKLFTIASAGLQLMLPWGACGNSVLGVAREAGRRILKGDGLVGSSGLLFTGNLIARAIGLLFVVAAARFLGPANYGLMAFALVIASFGTVLISNAPAGMSGFLARNAGDRGQQDKYFSNWVLAVAVVLAVSLIAIVPIGLIAGLRGWMIPALMTNLLGIAIFETYRNTQRGLANFGAMTAFYILANVVQFCAVMILGLAGFHSATIFVAVYGLTNVAALVVLQLLSPLPLTFAFRAVRLALARRIALISAPLLVQSALFAIWFGADLIMVRFFLPATNTGDYAASKTLVNLIALPAGAIGSALVPRIATLTGPPFRRQLVKALLLAAALAVPALVVLVALGKPIVALVFGARYPHAVEALPWLAAGMCAYAFYVVLESVWVGLGRPLIDAVATACGMVMTIAIGLVLISGTGLPGAGAAFALGALTQLAVIGAFTLIVYMRSTHAGRPIGRPASLEAAPAVNVGAV